MASCPKCGKPRLKKHRCPRCGPVPQMINNDFITTVQAENAALRQVLSKVAIILALGKETKYMPLPVLDIIIEEIDDLLANGIVDKMEGENDGSIH